MLTKALSYFTYSPSPMLSQAIDFLPHVVGSSVPSVQSTLPSHIRDSRMHFPSSHPTVPCGQEAVREVKHSFSLILGVVVKNRQLL